MSEVVFDDRAGRIHSLEKAVSWWRRVALCALVAVTLTLSISVWQSQKVRGMKRQLKRATEQTEQAEQVAFETELVAHKQAVEAQRQRTVAEQRLQEALEALERERKRKE